MIKGNKKPAFNEFESEMDVFLGDHSDKLGITHYFEILRDTFSRAAKALELEAKSLHESIKGEDSEIQHSILQSQESTAYPFLQTLYNSYFITLHSELESIWDQTIKEFNTRNQPEIKKLKLNSNYFNTTNANENSRFIDEAVGKHSILFTYNYIRNGLVHPKNDNACQDYLKLTQFISQGKIIDIEIVDSDKGFNFLIKNLAFGEKYASEILSFIKSIIEESVKQRQQSN